MRALSNMSLQMRGIYNLLLEHQHTAGDGHKEQQLQSEIQRLQSENQLLRFENQQLQSDAAYHKNQTVAGRHALSNAADRISRQNDTIDKLYAERCKLAARVQAFEMNKVQGTVSAGCQAPSTPETPDAEKRQRSDDEEQGTRQGTKGNGKRMPTWLGRCLNNEVEFGTGTHK